MANCRNRSARTGRFQKTKTKTSKRVCFPKGRKAASRRAPGRRARGRRADYTVDTAMSVDNRHSNPDAKGTWLVEFWDGTEIAVTPNYTRADKAEAAELALGVWEEYVLPNMDLSEAPAGWEPSKKDITGMSRV